MSRSAGSKDNKGSPSRAIARSKSTDTPGKSAQDHPSPSPGDSAVVRSLPGLDGKLLDAIEQDIVDPSASRVSFDDIASLDDAKRVLKEAVTLPLLLPDLFTGEGRRQRGLWQWWHQMGVTLPRTLRLR